jgi:AcrR family transcriptional regulator
MLDPNDNAVNIKTSAPDKKSYHHGDLRDALIEAGMRLLESRPAQELALREVAREVGVSATAVYRHFPDKISLLRAIAARGFALMGELQSQAAQTATGPAAFAAIGGGYVRFALRHPAIFRLMFSAAPQQDPFSRPLEELSGPMRLLRVQIAALLPTGLPESARKTAAIRAWSLVHGLAVLALDGMIPADDALIDAVITGAIAAL